MSAFDMQTSRNSILNKGYKYQQSCVQTIDLSRNLYYNQAHVYGTCRFLFPKKFNSGRELEKELILRFE